MSDGHSLVIHILDKEYRVACPPGEQDNLLRAARYLDNQMREVRQANVIGLERIAIMAALNMSHELLEAREQLGDDSGNDERIQGLLSRLDNEIRAFEEGNDETSVKPCPSPPPLLYSRQVFPGPCASRVTSLPMLYP